MRSLNSPPKDADLLFYVLQILLPQIEPLTEQQLMGIYNLQQSSQQAEDALSQGMETLQQTLAETLAWGPLDSPDSIMSTYLSQMAIAMGKLGTLESFIRQVCSELYEHANTPSDILLEWNV